MSERDETVDAVEVGAPPTSVTVADALWMMETRTLEAMLVDCEAAYAAFEPPLFFGLIGYSAPDSEAETVGRLVAGELWSRAQKAKRDELIAVDKAARAASR